MSTNMKILAPVLLSLTVIGLVSCQKEMSYEPGYNGSGGSGTGSLRMKVNGKQWVADKVAIGSVIGGFINISGQSKDGKTFTITLADDKARKYILSNSITSPDSLHAAAYSDSNSITSYAWTTNQGTDTSQAGGWVVVSKIDNSKKTISGTFQMKMYRDLDNTMINITEGVFENLPFENSLPPANASDTFKVKIDGTAWKPASIVSVSSNGQIAIVANENPINKTVAVIMPSTVTVGTYTMDALAGQYIGGYNPNQSISYASTSGTLTILEHNTTTKRIRGNFNFVAAPFTGSGSANLTEGYFSVTYQ